MIIKKYKGIIIKRINLPKNSLSILYDKDENRTYKWLQVETSSKKQTEILGVPTFGFIRDGEVAGKRHNPPKPCPPKHIWINREIVNAIDIGLKDISIKHEIKYLYVVFQKDLVNEIGMVFSIYKVRHIQTINNAPISMYDYSREL